jgi:CHAD domain-containing protein
VKTQHKQDATPKRLVAFRLFAADTLLRYVQVLLDERENVRQHEGRQGLHRMRVASRRLRSLLPWFAVCFPRKQRTLWRKELRRLGRVLGVARDTDVHIASVEQYLEACADETERLGVSRLLLRLQRRRMPPTSTCNLPTSIAGRVR